MGRGEIQDVNMELGDDMSRMLYEASKLTLANRPGLVGNMFDSFRGFKAIDGDYLGDMHGHWLQIGLDGVGTKVEIAERTKIHRTVAHDLFAMVCDDAVVRGGEPLAVGSILDVRNLNEDELTVSAMQQLCEGYVEAAQLARVAVVNGELAELGNRVDGFTERLFSARRIMRDGWKLQRFNYNWGAVVLWDALKERALDGSKVQPGDALVGFAERGFRSNGITDVRKAMRKEYGRNWHEYRSKDFGGVALGEIVQTPSIIYSPIITELTGGRNPDKKEKAEVHGVAHITGGGQPNKLADMLAPNKLGATISNPISPPEIMLHVQELRKLPDRDAYKKWHMGPGMIVATPEPEKVIAEARAYGVYAIEIGPVTDKPVIEIKNCGAVQDEEWLEFEAA